MTLTAFPLAMYDAEPYLRLQIVNAIVKLAGLTPYRKNLLRAAVREYSATDQAQQSATIDSLMQALQPAIDTIPGVTDDVSLTARLVLVVSDRDMPDIQRFV